LRAFRDTFAGTESANEDSTNTGTKKQRSK
jgi:hypothetical protein